MGLGGHGGKFPVRCGGGDELLLQIHQAILDELRPYFNVSADTEIWIEAYVDAVACWMVWRFNARLKESWNPNGMLDTFEMFASATGVVINANDRPHDIGAKIAAKFRGFGGNALVDQEEVASKIFGKNFVKLMITPKDKRVSYWPGVNPGPPGFEWASNVSITGVLVTKYALSDSDFSRLKADLGKLLDEMLPSWASFTIGTGPGFVVNQGIVGETLV